MTFVLESLWHQQWLDRTRHDSVAAFTSATEAASAATSNDDNPFDVRFQAALALSPVVIIVLAVAASALPRASAWLPSNVVRFVDALSPLVSDKDLKATRVGRLSEATGQLRRGAILDEDADKQQYSDEGFERQRRKNLCLCALALFQAAAWSVRLGRTWAFGTSESVAILTCTSAVVNWVRCSWTWSMCDLTNINI